MTLYTAAGEYGANIAIVSEGLFDEVLEML